MLYHVTLCYGALPNVVLCYVMLLLGSLCYVIGTYPGTLNTINRGRGQRNPTRD